MFVSRLAMLSLVACGGLVLPAAAGEDKKPDQRPIFAALDAVGKAYNAHDAKALAGLWAPDGIVTDRTTGARIVGRERLQAVYADLFQRYPKIEISMDVRAVRLITGDVAEISGEVIVRHGEREETVSDLTVILKKVEGKWLLDSIQEADLPMAAKPSECLKPLAWLVGQWKDQQGDSNIQNVFRWSANQAFLIRSYRVENEGRIEHEGTQVFGWDPEKAQIRTWLFNSDGSFGEGTCDAGESRLLIRLKGIMADGRKGSLTQILTREDADTMTSQLVSCQIDGELQPARPMVKMVRSSQGDKTNER
jgi:uncharacterized protein (TIGR02246 family)